ncbi:MAG: DNA-3-methyladenine glycosylase [Flavobacteriaceae bacterium]
MEDRLDTQEDFAAAVEALSATCPVMADVVALTGVPQIRRREPGFNGLLRIVVGQQLSIHAAAAIFRRLEAGGCLTPEAFAEGDHAVLRGCGLSGPKIRTLVAASQAVLEGRLSIETLDVTDRALVHDQLTAVTGIGPWTADIFLLFCLGHPDVWPAGDIALQAAVGMAHGLGGRPSADEAAAIAARWSPWRSSAAQLMWAYYGKVLNRKALPA